MPSTKRKIQQIQSNPVKSRKIISNFLGDDANRDIVGSILHFVEKKDWNSILRTCKLWNQIGKQIFIPDTTSLIWSIENNKIESVKAILMYKKIDSSAENNEDLIMYLPYYKGSINSLNDKRTDPFVWENYTMGLACLKGNIEIVKEFLKDNRFDPSNLNNYAIQVACLKGYVEIVKELLKDKRVDPSALENEALQNASKKGHVEVVRELLKDNRVDPNKALMIAVREKHITTVKELLKDNRVNPSIDKNFPIRWASLCGYDEIVEILLKDERVDPSAKNNDAIRDAYYNGHMKVVELLLKDNRIDSFIKKNFIVKK